MIRLAVRVRREQAELVLAELIELAPSGVEESEPAPELVEFAVYGPPGELPELPDVKAAAGDALVEVSTSEVADDWEERWKRFHRPVFVSAPAQSARGRRVPAVHVRPPWEAPCAPGGEVEEIVIDPGRAFGTGAHATTRMCLELLLELAAEDGLTARPGAAIDIGAGSGVLAIAAARLDFAPVLALDHEHESVEATRANAAVNGVELHARRFDLREESLPWLGRGDSPGGTIVALANLLAPLLLDLARTIAAPPTHLIASGLLREQADDVAAAFRDAVGLRERRRRERGEWAALWLAVDGG